MHSPKIVAPLLLTCAAAVTLRAQEFAGRASDTAGGLGPGANGPEATVAFAVRASQPPVIDGRLNDAIWETARAIDRFRMFEPVEDGDPRFRTEAQVAYDDRNLYVAVRAFDPHPDSIRALLARRDARTASDFIAIFIDSYHDRRSGFNFGINPAGVKSDAAIYSNSEEDVSWDAVWDAAARIDSLGWVAEFRIPLNQLRYPAGREHTFGLAILREVARYNERYSWPVYRRSKAGIASQFGELRGLVGIASPRRLEVAPYTVVKTANVPAGPGAYVQRSAATIGADLKYGLTSNLTIDATVNPDFGQVEADPSVLNLTAFETFFPEKRPFFLEGQGIFRFDMNCNDGSCSGLFYSRRIGRAPQLGGTYFDDANPTSTTILGAGKLTGRLSNGLSVGLLNATTQREVAPANKTIEPQTNYFVGRLQKDFRGGRSLVGAMLTDVRRQMDQWTSPYLRSNATVGGVDTRHEFLDRRYAIEGYVAASSVQGSAAAIAETQRSSVHNYQRPDDSIAFDSTRTGLTGTSFMVLFNKIGGGITRFTTGYQVISPGFESNDLGFLSRANARNQFFWYQVQLRKPNKLYRQWTTNVNEWSSWTADGLRQELGGNVNSHMQLVSNWWLHIGQGGNSLAPSFCDLCARGGPAVRQSRRLWGFAGIEGDDRHAIVPQVFAQYMRGDEGRSRNWAVNPSLTLKVASRFSADVGLGYRHAINDQQWYGNYGIAGNDTTHYTFARLDQRILDVTTRLNFTATPNLSLQVYAQPFMTGGDYSDWRELLDPRAATYTGRFQPFNASAVGAGTLGDFNFRQYRSNTVMRWEYRPGSALYLVWAQERTSSDDRPFSARDDYRRLFGSHPGNVFLIKGSYWTSF